MESIILIILVLPIFYIAFKNNKPYLYILCAFYPILPDTFAIELSSSLPLLTVKRILLIIGLCLILYKNRLKMQIILPQYFKIFIFVEFFIQLINLRYGISEIKNLIVIILEQLFLVIILVNMITDEEVIHKCIGFVVYGSMINAFAGILQTTISVNITKVLALVDIRSEGGLAPRMGLDRAFGFQDNAISFGCFCAFAFLLAEFMYGRTKKKIYIFGLLLNVIAVFCSMTRSAMLALVIIFLVRIIYNTREFLKKYLIWILVCGFVLLIGIMCIPKLQILLGPIKSILNILGANFELAADFGLNANDPTSSRLFQWSGIIYMIREMKGLFGYGCSGYERGAVYYYYSQYACWAKATALDVGFVGITLSYGLIGLFNYIIFFIMMLKHNVISRKYYVSLNNVFCYELLLIIMLNIASSFMNLDVFWLFVGMLISYNILINKRSI